MSSIILKKIKPSDKKYFAKWWRDQELVKLTSGVFKRVSDKEVDKYFKTILRRKNDYHFMIAVGEKTVGHISLVKRRNNWYETQIIIGEKSYWGKGHGTRAIKLLVKKGRSLKLSKIYLEVRPSNIRAIRAYEHSGFRKVGTTLYPENKYLPKTLRMHLE